MALEQAAVRTTRWSGGQHPSLSAIIRQMQKEGLRPYTWDNTPNYRYAVRSHNYAKVLYVVEGALEVTFPDSNQRVRLKPGDRVDIPARVRHGVIVGTQGVKCVEAAGTAHRQTA